MAVTIKTNRKWRNLAYRNEVPAKVLADQFDHLDADDLDGFFCYRGYWYHLSDFMRVDENQDLAGWHGYASDSYFSGVVMKLSPDGEQVMAGTYYS